MTRPGSGVRGSGSGNDNRAGGTVPGGRKRVAVVIFPGSNCDRDARAAVEAAGGEAVPVWHQSADLAGCGAVILPGGFSYGDYLRAGAMAAHSPVMAAVRRHATGGGAVLGICNGFQMLLEIGLLPGAMLMNRTLRFICRDVHLRVERDDLPLLKHLRRGHVLRLPIAHKEGNWFAAPDVVRQVEAAGAVALRYCNERGEIGGAANPNGAINAVAGLVNREGNVLGMMPHPERRISALLGGADGAALVRALVEAA
ncbi:MAG TPA: phosphoribosylformylglycinamidine synthase subunit PurQ [Thermoanaerobaculaceae bacterium]|nr:phosphoribosylformylglycinamidine synthase subunit PurQ [Thermoanaerobaculaceae bacterium]